ncbi:MAG TPA: FMN-binding negative transcriptional regulator [Flavitalea sp.]|nr:FMN-binding negative transcriptional regulator [Flavitalea sp.]
MYNLPYFKEQDETVIIEFMKQHPFVVLCGCNGIHQPVATQVPVLVDIREEKIYLTGHMMKQTDHHKAFEINKQALVLFTGPHTYVSASWYTKMQQASTWNYMTIHAKGLIKFLPEERLYAVLERTTALFENNDQSPSLVPHLPSEYVSSLSKAIIAFEIEVASLENVFKLSQNRDAESYNNIINKLKTGNEDARQIAGEMQKRAGALFGERKESVQP